MVEDLVFMHVGEGQSWVKPSRLYPKLVGYVVILALWRTLVNKKVENT
jgi:hypothetical protein